ncbi:hypothetical protein LJC04_04950 [Ruminococcaceae bacterium OttesenSCG-928-O06]|nr:hypothetical protein [Ruminococcaceae bacterium OttesenSCG-928-O06]
MGKGREKLKKVAWVALFLLLAALLVGAAEGVLNPKEETMLAFYDEPKNTVDVLFVGGSHAAAAFDPIQLWQQHGYTGYTLYSWGQPAWTSYHYVVEALKTQTPQVVVVEGFGFLYGRSYLEEVNFDSVSDDFSLRIRPGANRVALAMAMSRWQVNSRPWYRYAPLLRYHGRWKTLTLEDFTWPFWDHATTAKGFGPNFTTEAFAAPARPESPPPADLYPGCEEYLLKLIELAEREGFQLVVATAPYVVEDASEWSVLQRIQDICEANGVLALDYNQATLLDESGFSFETDMAEHAHVNLYGAEKITAHIGGQLAEHFALEDRRDEPAFAHWHEAAAVEYWDKTLMRLRLSPTAAQWFPRMAEENLAAFVVTRGARFDQGDNAPLLEGFAALGMDTEVLRGGGSYLAVVDGGRLQRQDAGGPADTLEASYALGEGEVYLQASEEQVVLRYGETNYALDYDGVHVLVVDKTDGSVVKCVVFRPEEGCITRTD